ncbi:MAG: nicotinate-nucleotide adenylyltransferase [Pseudomonadales bacterium]|nr:nicotinate-nucleotide adenylyltransferase [Pseudomonadales bacterium]MBO6565112.1 nicotinate-nucleotide adenylyltransferase [Pseudomonadales bacterium]MBO6597537.1 nicotinate-nucleotide adenylyltransferase [Pseudomonadales bacterium]MBO6657022.1 nicotinate-nucleotide adenylyltransferase [Pseudomonadales bacterium]MBO6824413.1 nicotinate-nucleotide adenylyltransferase [Pseudomonadales bacterium]
MTLKLVLGGTFDPVHVGHVNSACALMGLFSDCQVVLVPSKIPPHRDTPSASPEQRLKMLQLASEEVLGLSCDDCELRREGSSFTIDTLAGYRAEAGDQPLIFAMGLDAWVTLPTWHNWESLCDVAHLLIMERPGGSSFEEPAQLKAWAAEKLVDDVSSLETTGSGLICHVTLQQFDVSATRVRETIKQGDSTENMLHPEVAGYIARHHLYLDNESHGK